MKFIDRFKTVGLDGAGKYAVMYPVIWSQPYWRRIIPSFYYPYRFRGGRIYWDITESREMVSRVLGVYEPAKYAAVDFFLRPGDVFIDVGSNKGDFALYGARIVGNTGQVLAIEPDPGNCRWIGRSIALNGYTNVAVHEVALSDRAGKSSLYRGHKSGHHSLIPALPGRDKDVVNVEAVPLDDLVRKLGLSGRVSVIKIDVEGGEMMVLSGAAKTLRSKPQPVLLMDLHPEVGVDTEEVCAFLEDLGYAIYKEYSPFDAPVTDRRRSTRLVARPMPSSDRELSVET